MKIEELYPTDGEIISNCGQPNCQIGNGEWAQAIHLDASRAVAKFAVDNAVKKIVDELEGALEDEAYHNHRIAAVWDIVEALKELIK